MKVHSVSPHSVNCNSPKLKPYIPIDILDDLSSRFVINLPEDEKTDKIRLMFQIEMAHWFYIDFYCAQRTDLMKFNLYSFAKILINHIPFLKVYAEDYRKLFNEWKEYKSNVPTYGAILLDKSMQHVLLVQSFSVHGHWGFPKGKVNAEEDPVLCACREVKEETGFDCSRLIKPEEFIEVKFRCSLVRLYIVTGVDKSYKFAPQTRNEIQRVDWFRVDDLPSNHSEINEANAKTSLNVIPFIIPLRRWITARKAQTLRTNSLVNNNNTTLSIKSHKRPLREKRDCRRKLFSSESSCGVSSSGSDGASNSSNECNDKDHIPSPLPVMADGLPLQTKFWAKAWDSFVIEWDQIFFQVIEKLGLIGWIQ